MTPGIACADAYAVACIAPRADAWFLFVCIRMRLCMRVRACLCLCVPASVRLHPGARALGFSDALYQVRTCVFAHDRVGVPSRGSLRMRACAYAHVMCV